MTRGWQYYILMVAPIKDENFNMMLIVYGPEEFRTQNLVKEFESKTNIRTTMAPPRLENKLKEYYKSALSWMLQRE